MVDQPSPGHRISFDRAGATVIGREQDDLADALGDTRRDLLRDEPTHRPADEIATFNLARVHHPDHVVRHGANREIVKNRWRLAHPPIV